MSPEIESAHLESLQLAFCNQLVACLEECARGRRGLFSDIELLSEEGDERWTEAHQLRALALALQALLAQQEEQNSLCDEFLDLCSMHGESHPGERKMARCFLERIERGQVGVQTEGVKGLW